MHDRRREERAERVAVFFPERARANRRRDEQQADQSRRGRAEQRIEVAPVTNEVGERGGGFHRTGPIVSKRLAMPEGRRHPLETDASSGWRRRSLRVRRVSLQQRQGGQKRRRADLKAHLTAAASAFPRQAPFAHDRPLRIEGAAVNRPFPNYQSSVIASQAAASSTRKRG